jgi:hypothetical protein
VARKRSGPAVLSAAPVSLHLSGIFREEDVEEIAGKANLAVGLSADRESIASKMNTAVLGAHYAELRAANSPAPGAQRDAFQAVAAHGRESLLSLGRPADPAATLNASIIDIAKPSGVLRAIMELDLESVAASLPREVLERLASDDQGYDGSCPRAWCSGGG